MGSTTLGGNVRPRRMPRVETDWKERTFNFNLGHFGKDGEPGLRLIDPLGYLEFLRLQSQAKFVLTDSGGILDETTYLGVPCITMRTTTERPATTTEGTNLLSGPGPARIRGTMRDQLAGRLKRERVPLLWDGPTARRIVALLLERF